MKRILVIDDEPDIRDLIQEFLQDNYKCEIDLAQDGVNANFKTSHTFYDLIISDFKMPVIDGGEFLEGLKKTDNPNSKTTFIFISGYLEDTQKLKGQPNVFFVEKPIDFHVFQNLITKLLGDYSKSAA